MINQPRQIRRAVLGTIVVTIMLLVRPAPLLAMQAQTKEPPLPGMQPGPIPPPPPVPQRIIQQPQPVPIVPAPTFPPPGLPPRPAEGGVGGVLVFPPPVVQPPPGIMEVPCPPVDPPAPLVKLRVRVGACAEEGKQIEYRITVENCSPAPAHHVLVRNALPANCKFVCAVPEPAEKGQEIVWTFGTLNAGECREIVLVLTPTDTGEVKNCARVQFEHGECVVTRIAKAPPGMMEPPQAKEPPQVKEQPQVKETPPEKETPKQKEPPKVTTSGTPKLELKITGPKLQYANLPAKYQIAVTNTGDGAAENLVISAQIPENSAFLAASDNGVFHFGQAAWKAGNLPPGSSKTVEVTYRMWAAGEACIKATALADGNVRTEAGSCTKFEGASALHLETVDTKDPVEVGGETSYRITIYNQGTVDLTNVNIQILVPREVSLVRATGPTSPPPPEKLPAATAEGQTLVFAPLKVMKPGEKQVYEVFAKAISPGDARWKAVLTADQLTGGPVTEEESTTIFREDGLAASSLSPKIDPVVFPIGFNRHIVFWHRAIPFAVKM